MGKAWWIPLVSVLTWGTALRARAEETYGEKPAGPPRVILAFEVGPDGRLTVDAAGGPIRLGTLSAAVSPPGDTLEGVRAALRATAAARKAQGAEGLAGVTVELRIHPAIKWRPVEWLVRVVREEGTPERIRFVVRDVVPRVQAASPPRAGAPKLAARAVLSRATGKDAGASLLTLGAGRWVLPTTIQTTVIRSQRLEEAADAVARELWPAKEAAKYRVLEVEVRPEAAHLVPVVDVLDVLAAVARVIEAAVEFVVDPAPLPPPGKPAPVLPEGAFAALPPIESFDAFRGRRSPRADEGDSPAARAVAEALRWLAAHQAPDGSWGAATFALWNGGKRSDFQRRPDGLGEERHDVGVTGLALCAFLGAGYTDRGDHPYVGTVQRGLGRLLLLQRADGVFADAKGTSSIYDHATAALAVVEAYGMTGDAVLRAGAQKALDYVALARNPYFAWRYGVKPGDNDTSVTAWMACVLQSARRANEEAARRGGERLTIDSDASSGTLAWLDKMTDPDFGRVGYVQRGSGSWRPANLVDRFPADKTEAMTAAACVVRFGLGRDPRGTDLQKGLDLVSRLLPTYNTVDGSIDMIYWYWGSLATFQAGADRWKRWNDALQTAVVANQRMDTDSGFYKGSWDPVDVWGRLGGRVYSTAICALILETPTRYERVFPVK